VHAPTWDTYFGSPPLADSGTNVPQSAAPFEPLTVIANAWHPSWSLYEHALTVHSLTAGISVVVMSSPQTNSSADITVPPSE
jgi:hypothetical protein